MRKHILTTVLVLGFISVLNAQSIIEIDTENSSIHWEGSHLFKFNKHHGIVKFLSGQITVSDGSITGGIFKIDMKSILNTDGKYNGNLVGHLKSADFFDVTKYPVSKLEFVDVVHSDYNYFEVLANLTIKGVTNAIRCKGERRFRNGKDVMTSRFIIDRTLWGVNYESKGYFTNLKDDVISDAIEFEVTVLWDSLDEC